MMIKKFFKLFLIIDIGVVVFCLLQNNTLWLFNTQIAFISSLFIIIGSYQGYKQNIQKQINNIDTALANNTPDTINKLEDPFDLYDENSGDEVIDKKPKYNIKQTAKNTIKSFGAFSSLYRVVGYGVLLVGFFYLNNNHLLDPISYFVGFLIVPVSILISFVFKK